MIEQLMTFQVIGAAFTALASLVAAALQSTPGNFRMNARHRNGRRITAAVSIGVIAVSVLYIVTGPVADLTFAPAEGMDLARDLTAGAFYVVTLAAQSWIVARCRQAAQASSRSTT